MVEDANYTYPGQHFVTYAVVESLCSIPETNGILYVNYTSTENKKYRKNKIK